jgi:hypothetical protein
MTDTGNPLKKWALYVFLGGNVPEAPVREAAVESLLQMATVGSSDQVAVAAQLHLPGKWAHRYVMPERPPGSSPTTLAPVETFPNVNSADPWTMVQFFQWAAQKCPAEKTMFVIWGHGYGLDDYVPQGAKSHPEEQILSRTPFNDPFLEKAESAFPKQNAQASIAPSASAPSNPLVPMTAIFDNQHQEVSPNWQIAGAARLCSHILSGTPNRELAIFAFDACNMGMAEVWCEFYDSARVGIASEMQEPYASFPYDRFLARLHLQPSAAANQVAQMMVDAYVESFSYKKDTYVTLSSCDLTQISSLEEGVKPLAAALTKAAADPAARATIFNARNDCPIFDQDGFIDLGRFCEILEITLPAKDVKDACQKALAALSSFVPYARYSPLDPTRRVSQTTGLAVWFPPWLQHPSVEILEKKESVAYLSNGYPQTKFALGTGWDTFLKSMASAT